MLGFCFYKPATLFPLKPLELLEPLEPLELLEPLEHFRRKKHSFRTFAKTF